ncbi:hypothetical protein [Clostridium omnivorum]|uniref:Uncharacterized protein n=1 Tax=Clostridium omnivorum TaxID=1604902 RepID=A0ABQ5N7G1_9CLOT|nr:hypothetical protein [Clostridium sp. E14]GLC31127.1 hypothetical protein bsdE14_25370 [Clostridium sp. E14]
MKSSEIDIYDEIEFRSWVKKINLALDDQNYCNIIEDHNREMDNRKNISKNRYLENLPFEVRWSMEREINPYQNERKTVVMSINTSEKTRAKAYKFMNAFINNISKIGGRVYVDKTEDNDNTMFTLLESRYKCNLYEKQVKLRNRIKTENREMSPLYESEYNGDLYFEVFAEDKNDKWESLQTIDINNSHVVESELADLFWKLRDDAISKKIIIDQEIAKQQELREKQIRQCEEDKIREERTRLEKEELVKKQKMQEKIKTHMDKWEYTNRVLMYINELRSVSGVSDNERTLLLNYCDYVEKIYSKSEVYKEILEFSQELET